jgi:hypothetical protein
MNDRSIHGASCASYPSRRCGARLKTLLLPDSACDTRVRGFFFWRRQDPAIAFRQLAVHHGASIRRLVFRRPARRLSAADGDTATGAATYAVSLPGFLIPCNIGNATITGSITGSIGNQRVDHHRGSRHADFYPPGIQSFDGTTIAGTYNSTAGTAADGGPCGTAQTGLQWSATPGAPDYRKPPGKFPQHRRRRRPHQSGFPAVRIPPKRRTPEQAALPSAAL